MWVSVISCWLPQKLNYTESRNTYIHVCAHTDRHKACMHVHLSLSSLYLPFHIAFSLSRSLPPFPSHPVHCLVLPYLCKMPSLNESDRGRSESILLGLGLGDLNFANSSMMWKGVETGNLIWAGVGLACCASHVTTSQHIINVRRRIFGSPRMAQV